jgi:cytochrome c5
MRFLTVLSVVACVVATSGRALKSAPEPAPAVSRRPDTNAAFNPASQASIAGSQPAKRPERTFDDAIRRNAERMIEEGRRTFRFDTFGDEAFWGDTLKLHQAIEGTRFGGVGPGVSPATALAVGLKVDAEALSPEVLNGITRGRVDLTDPAVTLALLDANAIVGVTAHRPGGRGLASVGIQCSLCHSTVDNSVAPGIGRRLDGWPNRDLNVGAIIALAPDLTVVADLLQTDQRTVRAVLNSWGPGKFDAQLFLDGKAFRPDGKSAATLLPAAFGLAGVNLHTYTGWGGVSHWNALVANLEMHGKGTFIDARLDDPLRFPVASRAGFANVRNDPDLITAKLPALQFYQLSIPAPTPARGTFDANAAEKGKAVFNGAGRCSTCHVPPLFTEPGWNMHTAEEIGIDDFQSSRSPDQRYRTTPLAALFTRQKGGFYHDGRFADLRAVVEHYNQVLSLHLGEHARKELVEYLKSL